MTSMVPDGDGETTLEEAADRAKAATRQYAKRQRTWFRARMRGWHRIELAATDG